MSCINTFDNEIPADAVFFLCGYITQGCSFFIPFSVLCHIFYSPLIVLCDNLLIYTMPILCFVKLYPSAYPPESVSACVTTYILSHLHSKRNFNESLARNSWT